MVLSSVSHTVSSLAGIAAVGALAGSEDRPRDARVPSLARRRLRDSFTSARARVHARIMRGNFFSPRVETFSKGSGVVVPMPVLQIVDLKASSTVQTSKLRFVVVEMEFLVVVSRVVVVRLCGEVLARFGERVRLLL